MQLRLSDQPGIELDDGTLTPLALRDAALLAWLALEGPTSRERLCGLLWPASSDAQARTTLRQRLFQLKKVLGRDVAAGTPVLALTAGVSHDLAESGHLLGDLSLPDAPELEAWLLRQRAQRRNLEQDALRAQAQTLEEAGDIGRALPLAQALLRQEPLSEAAHQRVMRLHYLLGDRAAALTAFDACEQMLKHEVGAKPSPQTLSLLATIEAAGAVRALGGAAESRSLPVAVLRPPAMVGRDRELHSLQQAWAGAQVAAVVGEAGIGKSRLLAEFMAGQPGVVRAAGRPGDAGVPFALLARLLRAAGERGADAPLLPDMRRQVARVLPELGEASAGVGDAQRLQLQRALSGYLQGAAGLTGVVLDDLHFADAASLEMLPALITAESAALRWALAFRPAEGTGALKTLLDLLAESVCLAPVAVAALDEAALAALVNQLGLGVDGTAVAPRLRQRTGGNPLFVLEMLKQAWAEGRIAQLEAGGPLPRPRSVGQLIERRLARLSAQSLSLARVASIAGVDFGLSLAEAVLGVPSMSFADALAELEGAQVFRGLQFAHDLVFEAVHQGVPPGVAAHTHAKVAAHLERHQGTAARVAQHWIAAGEAARAIPWLRRAADEASAALQLREAFAFLEHLAEIQEALGAREAAFDLREEMLTELADAVASRAAWDRHFNRLDTLADRAALQVRAWLARARHALYALDIAAGEDWARKALAAALAQGDSGLQRRSQLVLFQLLEQAGNRTDETLTLADQCLPWIDEVASASARIEFHTSLGLCYDNVGRLSNARWQIERALEIATQRADTKEQIAAIGNLSIIHGKGGQLRAAVSLRRKAQLLSARSEVALGSAAVIQVNQAGALAQLGEYAEALEGCDKAETELHRTTPAAVPLVWVWRGVCWLHLGQRSRALQVARQVAAAQEAILLARVRGLLLAYRLSQQAGRPEPGHLETALALVPGATQSGQRLTLGIERALLLAPAQALEALDSLRDEARRLEHAGHVLETHLHAARMALALDPARACAHAVAALSMAERFDLIASYRGELWLHCARALRAGGRAEQGDAVAASGRDWVLQTAREHVPPEFQDSFLRRNPTNAALLALAARKGIAA